MKQFVGNYEVLESDFLMAQVGGKGSSASSYHCRSPRSQASIWRLPSIVGGSA